MSRFKGTFNFPANFEVLTKAPLDARMLVDYYTDLIDPSTWNKTGSGSWLFDGAIVVVANDPSAGIYWCKDSTNYTNYLSWERAGTDQSDVSIGVINVGDGSAGVFAGYDPSGNIKLRTILLFTASCQVYLLSKSRMPPSLVFTSHIKPVLKSVTVPSPLSLKSLGDCSPRTART